jgi:hypothetical protein
LHARLRTQPFIPVAELAYGELAINTALRRTWWLGCKDERIDALSATHLPLLFALDANLARPDAKTYCVKKRVLRVTTRMASQ